MFSKAKRFDAAKNSQKDVAAIQIDHLVSSKIIQESKKPLKTTEKTKTKQLVTPLTKQNLNNGNCKETKPDCSSIPSIKPFITPKPTKSFILRNNVSAKKGSPSTYKVVAKKPLCKPSDRKTPNGNIYSQELELRYKNFTIADYRKQIEELQVEIKNLKHDIQKNTIKEAKDVDTITDGIKNVSMDNDNQKIQFSVNDYNNCINELQNKIYELESLCAKLELESTTKQLELKSFEELIEIRDSLCKDLQNKLTEQESKYNEICQRLEMVKGHHALALEANESIRREYKVELETLKNKLEDDKQAIINKSKCDQESIKNKYLTILESMKSNLEQEKNDIIDKMKKQLQQKDEEMKTKIEHLEETSYEKLRLCEIQFEQRTQEIHDHWTQQHTKLIKLENELSRLKYDINASEEHNQQLTLDLKNAISKNKVLETENLGLTDEIMDLKDISKRKNIDFENKLNKLTLEVDNAIKEKRKYETSLNITREIVDVLSKRLRASDNDVENLENKLKQLDASKQALEEELSVCKSTLNNAMLECSEYKDALVNILKSKAALAKEHNRIMEHNVSLIESLQNVEKAAYNELGAIKNELIDDVELLKKESNTQIQQLKNEVEKKHALAVLAKEQAGEAVAAAEQSQILLAKAAQEFTRLETENQKLKEQIQDQQSLVVELSLLRQENEELAMTAAKQASMLEKIKADSTRNCPKSPKSPSLHKKSLKMGKENAPLAVSPLRERNFQNPIV